ncbi:MAG: hypothetical protein E7375_03080 [Clostridiales bacterium]|nr:hypothetical protein [Clostridiales bacterium]
MFLDKRSIRVDNKIGLETKVDFGKYAQELGWTDAPRLIATTDSGMTYYAFELPNHNRIAVRKGVRCEIRRINKGYLKDCYCLIEDDGKTLEVNTITDNGILTFQAPSCWHYEEMNDIFSDVSLQLMTVDKLTEFDVTRSVQKYESFCERLPNSCFRDPYFVAIVKRALVSERMRFSNVVNTKYINSKECATTAKDYFSTLVEKRIGNALEKDRVVG